MSDLKKLRGAQRSDRQRVRELTARIRKRAKRIAKLAARAKLAAKLKRRSVKRPLMVMREAEHAGLELHNALAMLDKETGIPQRNIFGCDHGGGRAFCHEKVTAARVDALLASGLMNGVGWTQITWRDYVVEAEELGGAHKPVNQCRVGFRVLAGHIRAYGQRNGFRSYNGSGPAAERYADEAVRLADQWARVID